MKIDNAGMRALTTPEELAEVQAVGTAQKRRRLKFAFWQPDLKGGRIPFWHVDYLNEGDFGTTLSLEGLRQWGKI